MYEVCPNFWPVMDVCACIKKICVHIFFLDCISSNASFLSSPAAKEWGFAPPALSCAAFGKLQSSRGQKSSSELQHFRDPESPKCKAEITGECGQEIQLMLVFCVATLSQLFVEKSFSHVAFVSVLALPDFRVLICWSLSFFCCGLCSLRIYSRGYLVLNSQEHNFFTVFGKGVNTSWMLIFFPIVNNLATHITASFNLVYFQ